MPDSRFDPVAFPGVMVSSTFDDLVEHRKALIRAIDAHDFKAVDMENDSSKPVGVVESSLAMVRKAAAYIGVIGWRYGEIPPGCSVSITELEFNEALSLGRPYLFFVMGPDHPVKRDQIETDPERRRKLEAFRERVLALRVCKIFNSLEEFAIAAMQSVGELRLAPERKNDSIPLAPAFYAEPPYLGSHEFVGRKEQLDTLTDWASAADAHPVLLFEAIGGAGKSMLTWEWTTRHATKVRQDWAGRFWYSFYERGAIMADFCRRALAYMTAQPLETFQEKKIVELSELLLRQLRARPWLLVLDGLERVLVAYHRDDAAQLADEDAGTSDLIARRDPCAAIRRNDDELLRALAAAGPSKLLLTSRLIPRVLVNPSGQAILGVLHVPLRGLRPADAEALLRSGGITGTSQKIQDYLQKHCDCHPLVTGMLAGLVNDYIEDRGNFDKWSEDLSAGGALNLADLDLVQKRNHIVRAAIDALPVKTRQLLSMLALVPGAVDYEMLSALNPHLSEAPEVRTAREELRKSVRDLENRGLLQYDRQAKRYDLHPVVRGVAVGDLGPDQKERYGQPIVDYFSSRSHSPYEAAKTWDDVADGIMIVALLIQMGHYDQAVATYRGALDNAVLFNLEMYNKVLSLIRPLFFDWSTVRPGLDTSHIPYLLNDAGIALERIGESEESMKAFGAGILIGLREESWGNLRIRLSNVGSTLARQNRVAAVIRCDSLAFDLASVLGSREAVFLTRMFQFEDLVLIGQTSDAEEIWQLCDAMGRDWDRTVYRPGNAEFRYAEFLYQNGQLTENILARAEELARTGNNRECVRRLLSIRGRWQFDQNQWSLAAEALDEASRMAREVEQPDEESEALLALANFRLGRLSDPQGEAEQLARGRRPSHGDIAALWIAIGDHEKAKEHALAGYRWAWADGEPYVRRHALNRARAQLELLGVAIPDLPPYDPARDPKLPWEDAVAAAIEKLKKEKAESASASPEDD